MGRRKKRKFKFGKFLLVIIFIALAIYLLVYLDKRLNNKSEDNTTIIDKIKDTLTNDDEDEDKELTNLGYSKDEIKIIKSNMKEEEINKINTYSKYLKDYVKISYFHIENLSRYDKLKDSSNYSVEETIMRVNTNVDKPYFTDIKDITNPEDLLVLVNKYYKFDESYVPSDLTQVEGVKMRSAAASALEEMVKDMRDAGYTVNLLSGYRSGEYQRELYNKYLQNDSQEEVDTYSARAGHSEHQSGLAIDLSDGWYLEDYFEDTDEFKWLSENAYKYGFIMRYPKDKVYMTGYIYEPWHYRYVGKEVAKVIYDEKITYEEYCVLYRGYY